MSSIIHGINLPESLFRFVRRNADINQRRFFLRVIEQLHQPGYVVRSLIVVIAESLAQGVRPKIIVSREIADFLDFLNIAVCRASVNGLLLLCDSIRSIRREHIFIGRAPARRSLYARFKFFVMNSSICFPVFFSLITNLSLPYTSPTFSNSKSEILRPRYSPDRYSRYRRFPASVWSFFKASAILLITALSRIGSTRTAKPLFALILSRIANIVTFSLITHFSLSI